MDLEIDLMYIAIDSTIDSDVFTFKLATCLQRVSNASMQHLERANKLVTQIVNSSMKALEDKGVAGLQRDVLSLLDNATTMLEAELM